MGNELICHCFNYTVEDIIEDAKIHGRSTIMKLITEENKAGACRCEKTNPKGR